MKKKKTKTIRKPRLMDADRLAELSHTYPNLKLTVRDRRAVIHWPETINHLHNLKTGIDTRYGVNMPGVSLNQFVVTMNEAVNAAAQWPMCSCGSLCRAIPRNKDSRGGKFGPPLDKVLRMHGLDFYNRLGEGNLEQAAEAMEKIEARATVLLRRLGKKKVSYTEQAS
jgi:hypothetical protein